MSHGSIEAELTLAAWRGDVLRMQSLLEELRQVVGPASLTCPIASFLPRDQDGFTLLHCTSSAGHADAAQLLIDQGLNVNTPDKSGSTALHVAAAKGCVEVIQLLLAHQASVAATTTFGWTPLHSAAFWGQTQAAEILLHAGCNPRTPNSAGQTPWAVAHASSHSNHSTLALLESCLADMPPHPTPRTASPPRAKPAGAPSNPSTGSAPAGASQAQDTWDKVREVVDEEGYHSRSELSEGGASWPIRAALGVDEKNHKKRAAVRESRLSLAETTISDRSTAPARSKGKPRGVCRSKSITSVAQAADVLMNRSKEREAEVARAHDTRASSSSNMTAFSEIKVSAREMVKNKRNRVQRRAQDHPLPPLEVQREVARIQEEVDRRRLAGQSLTCEELAAVYGDDPISNDNNNHNNHNSNNSNSVRKVDEQELPSEISLDRVRLNNDTRACPQEGYRDQLIFAMLHQDSLPMHRSSGDAAQGAWNHASVNHQDRATVVPSIGSSLEDPEGPCWWVVRQLQQKAEEEQGLENACLATYHRMEMMRVRGKRAMIREKAVVKQRDDAAEAVARRRWRVNKQVSMHTRGRAAALRQSVVDEELALTHHVYLDPSSKDIPTNQAVVDASDSTVSAPERGREVMGGDCIPTTSQDRSGQAVSTPEIFRNLQALGLEDLRLACKLLKLDAVAVNANEKRELTRRITTMCIPSDLPIHYDNVEDQLRALQVQDNPKRALATMARIPIIQVALQMGHKELKMFCEILNITYGSTRPYALNSLMNLVHAALDDRNLVPLKPKRSPAIHQHALSKRIVQRFQKLEVARVSTPIGSSMVCQPVGDVSAAASNADTTDIAMRDHLLRQSSKHKTSQAEDIAFWACVKDLSFDMIHTRPKNLRSPTKSRIQWDDDHMSMASIKSSRGWELKQTHESSPRLKSGLLRIGDDVPILYQ